jgi:hypothetical protein
MKTLLTLFVAISCLFGSTPHTMAQTTQKDRFEPTMLPPIFQNRDCKGDTDDRCRSGRVNHSIAFYSIVSSQELAF